MATTSARRFGVHQGVAAQDIRKRDLAQIHMGKAALGWSEDDYRAHLLRITGKVSAADLDARARQKVLEHMKVCGWKASTFKPFGQAEKIVWLWKRLGLAKAITDTSKPALMAFVGRTTGMVVADLKFLPVAQASTVIEALKAWLHRAQNTAAHPQK